MSTYLLLLVILRINIWSS